MLAAARLLGHLVALVAGAAAGLLGSFTFGYTSASVPVGLVVGLALSLGVFVLAGLALRSRAAAALATAGWVLMVGLLSMQRPEGDLVVPASTLGYSWLLLGVLVAGLSLSVPYATIWPRGSGRPAQAVTAQPSGTARTGR